MHQLHRTSAVLIITWTLLILAQENSIGITEKDNYTKFGAISIISNPPYARIFLNGKETKYRTPALLKKVKAGLNTIEVVLPNYMFGKRHVNVIADSIISLSFELLSLTDTAHIIGDLKLGILRLPQQPLNTPYLVDNKQIYYPDVMLNVGKHHVVWEGGNRYSSLDTVVEIFAGRLTTFQFTPQRLYGDLKIIPQPEDADIYLNNRLYSKGELEIKLATNNYKLRVQRKGYKPAEQMLTIIPKKRIALTLHLERIPDKDGDGFLDSLDSCPEEYGLYNGCPQQSRREAVRKYREIFATNLLNQPLVISFNTFGYLNRMPTNASFKEFISYFNDGKRYFNNMNGLIFANRYQISYRGFLFCLELGQWNSGLEYKKAHHNPVIIQTNKDKYCIYYDTAAIIEPRITLPSTAVSWGLNLNIKKFNLSYYCGFQWENIKIKDLITFTNYEKYKNKDSTVYHLRRYIGPRTTIIYRNNYWFNRLHMEYDFIHAHRSLPSLYSSLGFSFGSRKKTGWNSFELGIAYKIFPQYEPLDSTNKITAKQRKKNRK